MSLKQRSAGLFLVLVVIAVSAPRADTRKQVLTAADFAGVWSGTIGHAGELESVALELSPDAEGKVGLTLSIPVAHLDRVSFGRVVLAVEGDSVRIEPFHFAYDPKARTLTGIVPAGLIPVYAIPIRLSRVERFDVPKRRPLLAPAARPLWTFAAGSPLWAGPTFADGTVYAGGQDGRVYALDARDGTERWSFATGGPIRTRPAVSGDGLYLQADDGFLYALSVSTGALRWRVAIVERPIERLPFDHPKSRYDRFGSDVTVAGGRLYVGTHDGKVLALDPEDGHRLWEFACGDAVLAAPAVAAGRVYFGSYDHHVYAVNAADGALIWKRDTQAAVVSTPALHRDRVVIGTRGYDLFGLDAASGVVAWNRYIWMSWVESSATVRDGVAYVGSSDAVAVYAFDAETGKRRWSSDVFGWAWGQPAVTVQRVYVGTSAEAGYPVPHVGQVLALERATGKALWHYAATPADSGTWGFPGSPAVGGGHVFVTGLDGKVYAFKE